METASPEIALRQGLPDNPEGFKGRGIPFAILMDQVRSTAPFLFGDLPFGEREPHLKGLREWGRKPTTLTNAELTHAEYFRLCLQCHHGTVATFVPTDVDVHIRFKLWQPPLLGEARREMAELVLESLGWDFTRVSTRVVVSPKGGDLLSGHQGEWFSTAAAAYASCMKWEEALARELLEKIVAEVEREARIFEVMKARKDGIGLHQTATVIAHNLGDLDRVIDQWELPENDPLRKAVYKAGHEASGHLPRALWEAGELNKLYMANENHRHFALRRPRCLRRSETLLLPIAPFLDEWGRQIASSPLLSPAEIGEVAECLVDGWVRLPHTVGYARALAGMESAMPGGAAALWNEMPARNARLLQTGKLRQAVAMPRERFEASWNRTALKFLKLA